MHQHMRERERKKESMSDWETWTIWDCWWWGKLVLIKQFFIIEIQRDQNCKIMWRLTVIIILRPEIHTDKTKIMKEEKISKRMRLIHYDVLWKKKKEKK